MTGRGAEPRFQALVESLPGAVYRRSADSPWPFQYVSDTIESIVGHRASDLTTPGAHADGVSPVPEDRSMVAERIEDAVRTGRSFEIEYRVRHADGKTRWIEDRGKPVGDGEGQTWIDGVLFDVTERKAAELLLVEQR